jgi:hypothetical protein
MRWWLEDRVAAILRGAPSPAQPEAIGAAINAGVDFSAIYAEYGFGADGVTHVEDFILFNLRRRKGKS